MATNKRDLKAYVRYDGTGRIIPGSLVLRRSKPKVGDWKEIQTYECCDGGEDCTPPLFTPIEVRVSLEGDPCFGDYETATWYIYQTIESGIPVVKLVTEIVPPTFTPADAGDYLVPSINKVIIVAPGGFIADVIDGCA
jgi:hypothetical protein